MDTKAFEKEVRRMRMTFKDAIDNQSDGTCQQMLSQLQRLEDETQTGKSAGSLHARLKDMRRTAEKLVDSEAISHGDADNLLDWVESALQKMR